jgi:hypothetical protein
MNSKEVAMTLLTQALASTEGAGST